MEVHVESTGALTRSLHVTVPAEEFEKEMSERLQQFARQAKIPGFRPGKAPISVIRQRYGANARADTVNDLLQKTYPDALAQAEVSPAGQPRIEIESEPPEKPLGYVAHFDVLPEVTLDKLDSLEVERPQVEVTGADVDKLVENLRKNRRDWQDVERAAVQGDQVNIDFEGKLDGEAFPGGNGEKTDAEIGSGRFVADLENSLVGHKAGESFSTDVTFPEDYQAEDLRGKTAQFEVTVNNVQEAELPEVDGEFLKAHGVEESAGMEGLRTKCQTALESQRDQRVRETLKESVLDQLMAAHPIEIPPSRVDAAIEDLRGEMVQRMGLDQYSNTPLTAEKRAEMLPANLFEERAKKRVTLGLLMSQFIEDHKMEADEARVEALIDQFVADYDDPDQFRQYYRSNEQAMNNIRAMALEEQAVDALLEQAKVNDKAMSMDDLMNRTAPAAV